MYIFCYNALTNPEKYDILWYLKSGTKQVVDITCNKIYSDDVMVDFFFMIVRNIDSWVYAPSNFYQGSNNFKKEIYLPLCATYLE